MSKVYLYFLTFLSAQLCVAQVYDLDIANETIRVDSVVEKLIQFESLGAKPTGSPALKKTLEWITAQYKRYGYDPKIDTFKLNSNEAYNIIIEKKGKKPNHWIIIGAHYDSVSESPGANDNGSGVIATLEIARIIKNLSPQIGIRVINFSAEEQGYVGSSHYVRNTLEPLDHIQLMLNLDQLGGTKGEDNSKIYCERDEDQTPTNNNIESALKTDTLARLISLYTSLTPIISMAYGSDYVPFETDSMVITGLYQESDYNDYYHQSSDRVINMDVNATKEVIKGALAATLYFSRIPTTVGAPQVYQDKFRLYPNPCKGFFSIPNLEGGAHLQIFNQLGQLLIEKDIQPHIPVNVSQLPVSLYTVSIYEYRNDRRSRSSIIIAP